MKTKLPSSTLPIRIARADLAWLHALTAHLRRQSVGRVSGCNALGLAVREACEKRGIKPAA